MTNTSPFPAHPLFQPAGTAWCLCGSGTTFRGCCASILPGRDIGKKAQAGADRQDWAAALSAARADVTQYSIWHKSNTAPMLQDHAESNAADIQMILEIDVMALSEYVDTVRRFSYLAGAGDDVPAILERVRTLIDHDRWRRRVQFLQCLHALSDDWNEAAGRVEFKKLGSMTAESDIEILQLYLDLHGRELGLVEQLATIDRVIGLSTDEKDHLHYRSLKALTYLMAGDIVGAREMLLEVIERFQAHAPKHERSPHARHLYANTLQLAGCLSGDMALLDEAAYEIAGLLDAPLWKPAGKADLLRLRGDIHRQKSEWHDARETYAKAFDMAPFAIHQVFAAQCTLFADGPAAAAVAIQEVDAASLNQDQYIDYVLVLAHIAIESGERPLLASAESLLRAVQVQAPYFRQQCATLLLSVIDTARTGPTAERSRSVRRFSEFLFRLTRYVKLEPNVMGFGLNLGKMIDDANQQYIKPPEQP